MSVISSKWNIRLATTMDAEAVLKIYEPIVMETAITFELTCPSVAVIEDRIEASFSKHLWIVCEYENSVIGYAYASDFRKRLAYRWITEVSVYVSDTYQRRGVAKALYKALHHALILQGYQRSMAVMTCPNPASQIFHERAGYQHDVTWKNMGYKFDKWHDITIMSRQLKKVETKMAEIVSISELSSKTLNEGFQNAIILFKE